MTIRLHLRAIRVLAVVEDLPESLVVAVVAISSVIRCSACGHKTARVHATRKVKVRDLPVSGRPLTLVWHRRRFRCKDCRTTTTETHPFFANGMTTRLARAVVADARDMTIVAVARRHRLSWHLVMKLVLAEAESAGRARRRRPCRVLLVDEKSMRKGRGQFSTILTDGDRGRVIAVLKGRSADVLGGFLAAQAQVDARAWRWWSPTWPSAIASRCANGCPTPATWPTASTWSGASPRCWCRPAATPSAVPWADPMTPSCSRPSLLMKRMDRLSGEEMARLGALFDAHPDLGVVWGLVQRFNVVFCAESDDDAERAPDWFTDAYQAAGVNLGSAITTFCRWGTESMNFHRTGGATNGASEGVNTRIEVLERMAYGFASRANYPARLPLTCSGQPPALASLSRHRR